MRDLRACTVQCSETPRSRRPVFGMAFACSVSLGLMLAACSNPSSPVSPGATLAATPDSASASAPRVQLCHLVAGTGAYTLLTVGAPAERAHRAHGDGAVGEQVPGDPTMVFGADCVPVPVTISTVIDVTAGSTGTYNFAGQSFTTPGTSGITNLRFNWYSWGASPVAFGTLYLLSQEYLGLPGDLSPSTPGFIARSESIVGNQYVFAPGVSLAGGNQYWVYTDTQEAFVTSFYGSTYAGGDLYVTGVSTFPFHKAIATPTGFLDANFRLQGAVITP